MTTNLTEVCLVKFKVHSVQAEIFGSINAWNRFICNEKLPHVKVMEGPKLTSVLPYKHSSSIRINFEDTAQSTFSLLLNTSCSLLWKTNVLSPPQSSDDTHRIFF